MIAWSIEALIASTLLMIVVLLCTLVAVRMHGQEASSSGDADLHPWSGGNATT